MGKFSQFARRHSLCLATHATRFHFRSLLLCFELLFLSEFHLLFCFDPAATGAMALLMITLVKEHGLEYLLAATILTGVIQILAGYLKLAKLMRFVSKSVVIGFVNALAILIFMAQLPELINVTWHVYALVALGLAIIYLFPLVPKLGKLLPSPLVCIIAITLLAIALGIDVRTVGDMGSLPDTLPMFLIPNIPLNIETLMIILPYSVALAAVGLLESMMTATIVDEMTDTPSDKYQECKGQGIANIASGFMGGMAGCAMIGQSMINVKSGGLTRLSTLSGFFHHYYQKLHRLLQL